MVIRGKARNVKKKACIINIVKNQSPFSALLAAQPISHKPEDVFLRIAPPRNLDKVGDLPETLFVSPNITRGDPEYPGIWRPLAGFVRVFNGQL